MKMAILGYAHPFGEDCYYGAERIIWYLIQELKKKGHECVVFSVEGCNLPGFEYISVHKPWDDDVDIYLEAIRNYEKDHSTFDYIHSYLASGFISQDLRKGWPYSLEPYFSFGRFPENIIAYSKRLNRLNSDKNTVIYYGIPKEKYPEPEPTGDYAIWIGRIDMGKAPDIAIDVAKRAGIRLVLMGPAYHYPYFVDKIWPHIDNDKIIWLSSVEDEVKYRIMRKAKVFLSTNWDHYHEMFGITNIEALACGVPIIGWANNPEPSAMNFEGGEIITNGVQGFINEYFGYSPEEREKSVERAVEYIQRIDSIDRNECYNLFLNRFTSEIMTNKHLSYFEKVKERGTVLNITEELK
jgi:glycosyltransferase involved in cell wall biosynthesis